MRVAPIFRPAAPGDAAALIALDSRAQDPRTGSARRELLNRRAGDGTCHVAVLEGSIVAYAIFDHSFFEHGFISLVHVAEGHRRRGIATELLRHLERCCRTPKLFTSTNTSNGPMRTLLERLGYERSGVIENLDDGDPELVYVKRLPDSGLRG